MTEPTTRWKAGDPRLAKAALFSGDGFVSLANAPVPEPPFTVCFWMRWYDAEPGGDFDTSAPTPRTATLLSYYDSDDDSDSQFDFRIVDASNLTMSIHGNRFETGAAVDDLAWHHVAFSVAAASSTAYRVTGFRDGHRVAQGTINCDQTNALRPGGYLTVAQRTAGSSSDAFGGQLAELAIVPRILDADDLAPVMQHNEVDPASIHWSLDAEVAGSRSRNVMYVSTGIELPKPGFHVVHVDTSQASGRAARIVESGAALDQEVGPGTYTIDIDDLGRLVMEIDDEMIRLNGQSWRAEGDVTISVREDGYFWTSVPRTDGYVQVSLGVPVEIGPGPAGITSRSVLVEDYPNDDQGVAVFSRTKHVYRTMLTMGKPATWIDLSAEPAVTVVIDGSSLDLHPRPHPPHRIDVTGRRHLGISIVADAIGTSKLSLRTSEMAENTVVTICPDVDAHRKVNALDPHAFATNREQLGISTDHSDALCHAVQAAVQNVSRAVEHTYQTVTPSADSRSGTFHEKRVNPRRMADTHWMLDLTRSSKPYSSLNATQVRNQIGSAKRLDHGAAHGLLDDIGHAFSKAEKIVVHTARSAVHDVAETGDTIWNDATRTAEHVGDDLVHGDAQGVFTDLADGIVDTVTDAGKGVASLAGDVAHGAEELVVITVHLAEEMSTELGKVVQFALDHSGVVGEVIRGLVAAIELGVSKLVSWLADELGWGDILRTQRAISARVTTGLDAAIGDVTSITDGLKLSLEDLRNVVDKDLKSAIGAATPAAGSSLGPSPSTPKHSASSERLEWLTDKMTGSSSAPPPGNRPPASGSLFDELGDVLTSCVADPRVAAAINKMWADVGTFVGDPLHSGPVLLDALLEFVDVAFNVLIDVVEGAIELIGRLLVGLLEALEAMLKFELQIPFLTPLFAAITADDTHAGEPLTLLNLVALLIAVPATLACKAAGHGEPFPASGSAAQAQGAVVPPEVSWMYVYGAAQIADGVLSAVLDAQFEEITTTVTRSTPTRRPRPTGPNVVSMDVTNVTTTVKNWEAHMSTPLTNTMTATALGIELAEQLIGWTSVRAGLWTPAARVWYWQWLMFAFDGAAAAVPLVRDAKARHRDPVDPIDPGRKPATPLRFLDPPIGIYANLALELVHLGLFVWQLSDETGDHTAGASLVRATYLIDPLKGLFETALVAPSPKVIVGVGVADIVLQTGYGMLYWSAADQRAAAATTASSLGPTTS